MSEPKDGAGFPTWIAYGAIVLIVGVVLPIYECDHQGGRDAQHARFAAYLDVGDCFREGLAHPVLDAVPVDPRRASFSVGASIDEKCTDALDAVFPDDDRADAWRDALTSVREGEGVLRDYYQLRGWTRDAFASGPAKWAAVRAAEQAQVKAARAALPLLAAMEQLLLDERGKTVDERWHRIDVAARAQVSIDDALRGGATGAHNLPLEQLTHE